MCDCCQGSRSTLRLLTSSFARRSVLQPQALSALGDQSTLAVPPPPPPPSLPPTHMQESPTAPEVIIMARKIRTMTDSQPVAEALVVHGGLLQFVGSRREALSWSGPQTQIIDLGQRTVLPGFIDPHMHSVFSSMRDWLDLSPFTTRTVEEAAKKIKAAAAGLGKQEWVKAKMLDFSLMQGEPFDRFRLDELSPNSPVFVMEVNGHVSYVNSRALQLAQVNGNTPDPPTARFVRSTTGELTGRLEESEAFKPFLRLIGLPSPETLIQNITSDFTDAALRGCTTLHDCGIGLLHGRSDIGLLDAVMAGDPPVRLAGMLVSTHMKTWADMALRPGQRSHRFYLNGIKTWADGSVAARTGFMRSPYLNTSSCGALNYTPQQIEEVLRDAHGAGWQVGIHCNGDAAIDVVLEKFGHVLGDCPRKDHRHRIEHASFLRSEHIATMAQLNISPSFLIGHVHYWGKTYQERILGKEYTDLLDPCASALEAGLRISLHSDFAVTPLDPLRCIQNAVVRDMRDGGDILNPAERISPLQAIRAMTLDAAWQCKLDHLCGSLEVGKAADLVVLEADPLEVDPDQIINIKVHSTWLEGTQRTGPAPEPKTNL